MNRHAGRWRMALCAAAVVLGVTACTSGSTDGPTTSGASTSASLTVTPSVADVSSPSTSATPIPPSVLPTSEATPPTPTSLDADAKEAADRAEVEAAWVKFWGVYNNIVKTPADQREAALDTVSIDPLRSKILTAAQTFDSQGLDYYGSVVQHPYWVTPINGQPFAVMRDCQDQSNWGSIYTASGEIRSLGVDHNSLQAGFILGDDGVWRVQTLTHLENVPCQ